MPKRFAVYTAIFGDHDQFVQLYEGNFDYFLFTDREQGAGWGTCRVMKREYEDATRDARRVKILAHQMLPEYEYTLWIDGSMRCESTIDPEKVIGWLEGKFDLATFKHPERGCVYDEEDIVAWVKRDRVEVIKAQMDRYRRLGYPSRRGLAETAIMLRKNTRETAYFNDVWWNEVKHGSRRDQLGFPFAAWISGLNYRLLEGVFWDYGFRKESHLK